MAGPDLMRGKAVLVLASALGFASAPFWSGDFSGFDPGLYPIPQSDPPAQPAGYAFAIWGVIYLWLIAMALFGLLRRAEDPDWDAGRWSLIASLAVGTSWLLVAQQSALWATALIWTMLAGALWALFRAPMADRVWLAAPVGLYAGWLTAASFVSLALTGAGFGVAMGQIGWAWTVIAGALALGLWVQMRVPHAPSYGAALAWALVAVAVQNWGGNPGLAAFAAFGALAAAGAAFVTLRRC